jgi:uncharacterized protein YqhQ
VVVDHFVAQVRQPLPLHRVGVNLRGAVLLLLIIIIYIFFILFFSIVELQKPFFLFKEHSS